MERLSWKQAIHPGPAYGGEADLWWENDNTATVKRAGCWVPDVSLNVYFSIFPCMCTSQRLSTQNMGGPNTISSSLALVPFKTQYYGPHDASGRGDHLKRGFV